MNREAEIRWLYRELAKHQQPCRCPDCASARAELLFWGELLDNAPQAVERAL